MQSNQFKIIVTNWFLSNEWLAKCFIDFKTCILALPVVNGIYLFHIKIYQESGQDKFWCDQSVCMSTMTVTYTHAELLRNKDTTKNAVKLPSCTWNRTKELGLLYGQTLRGTRAGVRLQRKYIPVRITNRWKPTCKQTGVNINHSSKERPTMWYSWVSYSLLCQPQNSNCNDCQCCENGRSRLLGVHFVCEQLLAT